METKIRSPTQMQCNYKINWLYTKCWGKERAYKINLKNFQKKQSIFSENPLKWN